MKQKTKIIKWFCNECGHTWFSKTEFEDLCPNTLCESEHIYYERVKEINDLFIKNK